MAENPLQEGLTINFAQNGDKESKDRLAKRLSQSRGPSSQQSSLTWVDWGSMEDALGQPFDTTRIPLSKLDWMRRDPMLAFGLAAKIIPLVRAKWHIESTDPQRAAFVTYALAPIYARYVLGRCNALSFGFSPGVKRFEYIQPDWTYFDPADPNHVERDVWPSKTVKALVWKSFVWLDPREVRPHWNYKGEFAGIDFTPNSTSGSAGFFGTSGFDFSGGRGSPGKAADIPLDWAIWATNEKDSVFGSVYGFPLIGHAYRYWWSYWYKFGLSDRAFERWADPPVIIYHPAENGAGPNGEVIDFASVALGVGEQFRGGANISMPTQVVIDIDQRTSNIREWDIRQIESTVNFDSLLGQFNYLDVLKLRSIMVPEMGLIEGAQGQSSRNVASVFSDHIQKAQAVLMEEIDFEINRFLIPQLLEANFGPGGATCRKITTGFDPQDLETMRAIIGAIANKHGDIADVDTREMLAHLGIPLLSYEAVQEKLRAIAEEKDAEARLRFENLARESALKGHKPVVSGTSADQSLSEEIEDENKLSLWQRVASLFYDAERTKEQEREIKEAEQMQRTEAILDKMTELANREVNLEVKVPEMPVPIIEVTEQPKKFRRIRKIFNRDEEDNIISVDEIEIEEDDEH